MIIVAIDPGNVQSAYVVLDGTRPLEFAKVENDSLRRLLNAWDWGVQDHLAIETLHPRGMSVSYESMQTQFWAGRFAESWGRPFTQIDRKDVKMCLCGVSNAKDSNIRTAIIDRYGGQRAAIGGWKCKVCNGKGWRGAGRPTCGVCNGSGWDAPPGPLNSVAGDCWAAIAVALTWIDRHSQQARETA